MAAFFPFQSYQLGFQNIEKDQIKINKCFQISDLGRFSETILQSIPEIKTEKHVSKKNQGSHLFTFQSYLPGFQKSEKYQIIINKCFQISDLGGS